MSRRGKMAFLETAHEVYGNPNEKLDAAQHCIEPRSVRQSNIKREKKSKMPSKRQAQVITRASGAKRRKQIRRKTNEWRERRVEEEMERGLGPKLI